MLWKSIPQARKESTKLDSDLAQPVVARANEESKRQRELVARERIGIEIGHRAAIVRSERLRNRIEVRLQDGHDVNAGGLIVRAHLLRARDQPVAIEGDRRLASNVDSTKP